MAMSTLFAVLGGAISFAVFLTSYMQVERMDAQNKLIEQQIKQTDQQMKLAASPGVAVALSIAERRQVTSARSSTTSTATRDTACGDVPLSASARRSAACPTSSPARSPSPSSQPYKPVVVSADDSGRTTSPRSAAPSSSSSSATSPPPTSTSAEALDLSAAFLDHADLHAPRPRAHPLPRVACASAKLYDADLTAPNLAGADLTPRRRSPAKTHRRPTSPAPSSTSANLTGADLAEANLVDADLTGANLKAAVLQADPARQRRAPRRQPRRRAT
jgi:hypothetical protein